MKQALTLTSKILLAFSLPLALAYFFLVIPQIKATSQALADVDSLRQSGGITGGSQKQRTDYLTQLSEVRTNALTLIPTTDNQYDLSVQVEALAKEKKLTISGLTVSAVVPTNLQSTTPVEGTTTAGAGLLKVTVTVSVTGTYANIQSFVASLPALDRFIQIDQITITSGTDGLTNAQLTAFAYYLPAVK